MRLMSSEMSTIAITRLFVLIVILAISTLIMSPPLSYSANSAAIRGKVVGVHDGDTITVLTKDKVRIKVRLYGIDCPESGQAFGQRAKQVASEAVFGKQVSLVVIDTDHYGRTVAIVKYGGQVLQETLLKAGMAWVYNQHCKDGSLCNRWRQLQAEAKQARRGLWRDKRPVPPWDWRRGGDNE